MNQTELPISRTASFVRLPENTTRLRRFAIQLIKARGLNVAETLRRLNRNVRCVFDFLKMTANTQPKTNR